MKRKKLDYTITALPTGNRKRKQTGEEGSVILVYRVLYFIIHYGLFVRLIKVDKPP
jgi:hypothetical protein